MPKVVVRYPKTDHEPVCLRKSHAPQTSGRTLPSFDSQQVASTPPGRKERIDHHQSASQCLCRQPITVLTGQGILSLCRFTMTMKVDTPSVLFHCKHPHQLPQPLETHRDLSGALMRDNCGLYNSARSYSISNGMTVMDSWVFQTPDKNIALHMLKTGRLLRRVPKSPERVRTDMLFQLNEECPRS